MPSVYSSTSTNSCSAAAISGRGNMLASIHLQLAQVYAGEVHENQLAFAPPLVERRAILILQPDRPGLAGLQPRSQHRRLRRRHKGVQIAQPRAEHAGRQAEREHQERHPDQQPPQAHGLIRLDAFQPQESQQVQTGHGEQHDPHRQEARAGEQSPAAASGPPLPRYFRLAARITNAHHHLHARQPAAAPGQALQVRREQRQQEERQRQPGGERHHAGQRPQHPRRPPPKPPAACPQTAPRRRTS